VSLWPLARVSHAIRLRNDRSVRVRLSVPGLDALAAIAEVVDREHAHIEGIQTQRRNDRHEIELDLRLHKGARPEGLITGIGAVPDVNLEESDRAVE